TFYFELEYGLSSEEALLPQPVPHELQPGLRPKKVRVLLAEDNRMNQVLASKILDKLGYTFSIANNGREALKQLEESPFDVVLMDIQMPEIDGYEAARRIRAHADARVRETPIIALTAHALAEEVDRCLAAGMDEFISKPFQPDNLRAKIAHLVCHKVADCTAENGPVKSITKREYSFINLAELEKLADGQTEFKFDLIDVFLEESSLAMAKIRLGIENKDGNAIYQAAHAVKPSFVLFQVKDHAELFSRIEELATMGGDSIDDLQSPFAQLENNLLAAEKELRQERSLLTL
ncbi:MAG TPA: response regulator, partial [Bacteroidetes bacterium]|nr:response regulator [Bacteroidota bacterium]